MGDPNDNLNVKDQTTSIGDNDNKNAKDHLGIMALIVIIEPATECQAYKACKQPLKGHPSNKIKVLLDSGSDGDLFFLPKGRDKPFPYLARQVPNSWHMPNGTFQMNGRGKVIVKFFE